MQAINRLLSQNCNCYPHLFRCSTIKIHNSFQLPLKTFCCLAFITFQYIVQFSRCNSSTQAPYHSPHRKRYVSFSSLCLLFLDKRFAGLSSEFGFDVLVLKPDLKTQSLKFWDPTANWIWWARVGSNHRPYDYQSYALASWATGPYYFLLVEIVGIEPATSCLQGRRSPSWAISPSYLRLAGLAYTL